MPGVAIARLQQLGRRCQLQRLQLFQQRPGRGACGPQPERFADGLPPEALGAADEVGGEEDARRHLVALQQRVGHLGVVAPAVIEGQGQARPVTAGVLQQVIERHTVEMPPQPAQQVLELALADAQWRPVRPAGGLLVGQHPVQHQHHPGFAEAGAADAVQVDAAQQALEVEFEVHVSGSVVGSTGHSAARGEIARGPCSCRPLSPVRNRPGETPWAGARGGPAGP